METIKKGKSVFAQHRGKSKDRLPDQIGKQTREHPIDVTVVVLPSVRHMAAHDTKITFSLLLHQLQQQNGFPGCRNGFLPAFYYEFRPEYIKHSHVPALER